MHRTDNLNALRANCLEIWEPQPPGTLGACPGLYRGSLLLVMGTGMETVAGNQELHLAVPHTKRKFNDGVNIFCQMELEIIIEITGDKTSEE